MPQEWFTLESLGALSTAVVAVRIVVEYTKEFIDTWTAGKLPTFWYAVLWSIFAVFGLGAINGTLGGGNWFAGVFNVFLVAVLAGVMDKDGKSPFGK